MTEQPTPGLERTLLWIATGYRVFGAAWMALIGVLVLRSSTDPAGRPGVLATSLAIVIVWTALGVILALQRPRLLRTWAFVVLDIATGVFSVVVAAWAESPVIYAAGYPLAAVFGAIYARGTAGGAVAALALTGAALSRVAWRPDDPNQFSIAISYLFSAVAATGAVEVLRRSDRDRVAAEEALVVAQAAQARADERADVAAHLHDSVLQTLALIQREATASDPVRRLARRQERELRQWLYRSEDTADQGFRDAINAMAAEVDDMSDVDAEAVIVGDRAMDTRHEALIRAGREAAINAVKHSGAAAVSIYAEVAPDVTLLFVKDRGVGFDTAAVPDDRRGIADSIVGRIERHGGTVVVTSAPGQGTEIRMTMPEETAT